MDTDRVVKAVAGVVVPVALTLLTACGAGAPAAPAGAPPPEQPRPLRILVSNDDGWSAPGITALRDALARYGNTVTTVAPAGDQSGTGGALTVSGPLTLARPSPDPAVWAVGGRPADSVAVGLRSVLAAAPPDLVVSGINSGNNVTASTFHSGTVGAAMTAVEYGVPAIAVSGPSAPSGSTDPRQYAAAADFTARLVGVLSARPPGQPLLPPGMILNVNHPRVAPEARASRVVAAPTADQLGIALDYTPGPDGTVLPRVAQAPPLGGDDDASAVARGEIALTDLAVDPEAPSPAFGVAAELAPRLRP